MTRPLLTRQDLGKDTAMPSHRLFVSGFAIISVLSVALPAVATELTPQQIYERAAPAVVLVIGHSEEGGNGSGGGRLPITRGGGGVDHPPLRFVGKKRGAGPPLPVVFHTRPATGKPQTPLSPQRRASVAAY